MFLCAHFEAPLYFSSIEFMSHNNITISYSPLGGTIYFAVDGTLKVSLCCNWQKIFSYVEFVVGVFLISMRTLNFSLDGEAKFSRIAFCIYVELLLEEQLVH